MYQVQAEQPAYMSKLKETKFQNNDIDYSPSLGNIWEITKAYIADKRQHAVPQQAIPVLPIDKQALLDEQEDVMYKLGHSTILLKLDGEFILIDPVFSERASFVQWIGPKRFHAPPIQLEDLPDLKAVIISHNHYDHMDKASIQGLVDKTKLFVVPLRNAELLESFGVPSTKVVELDWWQKLQIGETTIHALPSQHFSGRGLFDSNQALWASWAIKSSQQNIFYSGDSGYFKGFKEIGEKLGPFDYSLMETGAYNPLWAEIHMTPEQSVAAHVDVKAKQFIPVHNSTFDLALHDWFEPLDRALEASVKKQASMLAPRFGERLVLSEDNKLNNWWQALAQ